MTVVNVETGELVEPMGVDDARRLTEKLRLAATNYVEAKAKVLALVDEAKAGRAHVALGYKSWTAYLSDVLSDEPLRLAREQRPELSSRLADEGMSNVAIGKVLGVSDMTVARDIERHESTSTNVEVDEPKVRVTEGRDGRTRTSVTAGHPKRQPDDERPMAEANALNALRSLIRRTVTPEHVATLSPRARALMVDVLNEAIQTLQGADQ